MEKHNASCIVSNRILAEGRKVGYLWREAPRNPADSGWTFLAGDESDAYCDKAENFACVALTEVLSRDGSVAPLLDAPVGTAYERDPGTGAFTEDEG